MKKNVLGVLKNDMDELIYRINTHHEEYLRVFSSERTRKHFEDVFFSRYRSITGSDLALISEEELRLISKFYHLTYDLHLYLKLTEDMPSAVANKHSSDLKEINDAYKDFVEYYLNSTSIEDDHKSGSVEESEEDSLNLSKEDEGLSHGSSESEMIDLDSLHLGDTRDSKERNLETIKEKNFENFEQGAEENTEENTEESTEEIVFDGLTSLDELDDEEEHKPNDDEKRENDAPPPF